MSGRTRILLFVLFPLTAPLSAQVDNTGLLSYMPEEVQQIRKEQGSEAAEAGVQVVFNDVGMMSSTAIQGIPLRFRDLVITHEDDLIGRIEELYPLLGFRGTETLRFSQKYQPPTLGGPAHTEYFFSEFIHGIRTTQVVIVDVDDATKNIRRIEGLAVLDRGFPRASLVSESDAKACGRAYIRDKDMGGYKNSDVSLRAEKVLDWEGRVLEPWWDVYVEATEGGVRMDVFRIAPSEKVFPSSRSSHGPYKEIGYCLAKTGKWEPLPTETPPSP